MRDSIQFQWGSETVAVRVRHSLRARRVYLKVLPPTRVELVVPRGVGRRHLPAILESNRRWLTRTLERMRSQHGTVSPFDPPDRIRLATPEEQWDVEYLHTDSRCGCRQLREGRLQVASGGGLAWRELLLRWLARRARDELGPRLSSLAEELDLAYNRVTIRGQRTRWGSCSSARTISLNYRLLFLPPPLVRYLLVHELCHTVHLNHSPDFWALVAEKEPDFRSLDSALRQAGRFLPTWSLPI